MKDPPAEGKHLLKPLVWVFLEKLKSPSRAVKQMAARGLGRAVSGLPKKVRCTSLCSGCSPPAESRAGLQGSWGAWGRAAQADGGFPTARLLSKLSTQPAGKPLAKRASAVRHGVVPQLHPLAKQQWGERVGIAGSSREQLVRIFGFAVSKAQEEHHGSTGA